MITFRQARESDLPELLSFPEDREDLFYFFPSARPPLTLEQLEKQLNERYKSTVMLDDNEIVGFANFYNVQNHNIAFIGNVIIRPDRRNEGLGQQLIQSMLTTGFRDFKLKEVHLSCYSNNTGALLFYSKLGFKPYSIEPRVDQHHRPTALIHLRIKNQSQAI